MNKPNGKPSQADQFIQQTIQHDNPDRPATKGEFDYMGMLLNLMTQQIVGLDIALNMLVKQMRNFDIEKDENGVETLRITPWSEAQHEKFKVDHKAAIEDYRKKMECAKKAATQKVTLV